MSSVQVEARLAELRAIGQTRELTQEEAREALKLIRDDRESAAYASKASKAKTVKADPAAVLKKLQDLMEKK